MAIDDVNNVGKDVLVGFDTEGSIKVLQLFFYFGDSSYTIVFQLTRHQRNGNAFSCIQTSSSREKKVNKELVDVMLMCGIQPPTIAQARFVEVQWCFETI